MDMIYLLPTNSTGDDIKKNLIEIKNHAVLKCYERLKRSKYKGIQDNFLEIKRIIWRKNFSELIITIGLKHKILELKEKMTTDERICRNSNKS